MKLFGEAITLNMNVNRDTTQCKGIEHATHENCRKSWTYTRQQASVEWEEDESVDDVIRSPEPSTTSMEVENDRDRYKGASDHIQRIDYLCHPGDF